MWTWTELDAGSIIEEDKIDKIGKMVVQFTGLSFSAGVETVRNSSELLRRQSIEALHSSWLSSLYLRKNATQSSERFATTPGSKVLLQRPSH